MVEKSKIAYSSKQAAAERDIAPFGHSAAPRTLDLDLPLSDECGVCILRAQTTSLLLFSNPGAAADLPTDTTDLIDFSRPGAVEGVGPIGPMSGDRDKCGLSSLLPMSCRGRAESFARRLHSRLRSLGSQDCDSSADENSWLAAHEATSAVSLQPRHSSDSDLYFHFGLLESPGSPVDEVPESEFSKLITNPADNLHPAHTHGTECHCPKKKEAAFALPKGSSQDSDSSDGVYYDLEITETTGLDHNCTNHVNGVCSPAHHEETKTNGLTNHKEEAAAAYPDEEEARENGQSDGIVSPVSSESTAAPPSLTLSEAESTLSLHDDETNEYTSLEYSQLPDVPLTELHEERYLYHGQIYCNSTNDSSSNDNQPEFLTQQQQHTTITSTEDLKCQNEPDSECSTLQLDDTVMQPQQEANTTTEQEESCRDIVEAQCNNSTKVDNSPPGEPDTQCSDLEKPSATVETEATESYCNKLEVDKEMVMEFPGEVSEVAVELYATSDETEMETHDSKLSSSTTVHLEVPQDRDKDQDSDSSAQSSSEDKGQDSSSSDNSTHSSSDYHLISSSSSVAMDISKEGEPIYGDNDDDEDEETKEACRFLQSLGSPKKEFKEVCQLLQHAEDQDEEDEKESSSESKCETCEEEERIPRVRRCSSLKTGKTPPGTPGRKKIVRFADVLGLDLADVRTFMDEIPKVPAAAYNDLAVADLCHAMSDPTLNVSADMASFHGHVGPKPEKVLVPLFQQPSSLADFLDKVKERQCCLENAVVLDPITLSISGTVRVRNLDFHKSVHIRYSLDSWKSFADLQAIYCPNSCDGFSDKFEFLLYCHTMNVGQRIEFAVRFQCKGFQYWDNNCGANYCFQCLPASSGSQYMPITGIEEHWSNSAVFY